MKNSCKVYNLKKTSKNLLLFSMKKFDKSKKSICNYLVLIGKIKIIQIVNLW